jgi:hypothetical protein
MYTVATDANSAWFTIHLTTNNLDEVADKMLELVLKGRHPVWYSDEDYFDVA